MSKERLVQLCNLSSIVGFRYFPQAVIFRESSTYIEVAGPVVFLLLFPRALHPRRDLSIYFCGNLPSISDSTGLHRRHTRKKNATCNFSNIFASTLRDIECGIEKSFRAHGSCVENYWLCGLFVAFSDVAASCWDFSYRAIVKILHIYKCIMSR